MKKEQRCPTCGVKCYPTIEGQWFCQNDGIIKTEKELEQELYLSLTESKMEVKE